MLVSGDFSGRTNRGVVEPLAGRHPVSVDCDNFEEVMARLGAELRLPASTRSGPELVLRFETLDDFHPDNLVKQAGALAALLQTRRRLQSPATATEAVAEAQRLLASAPFLPSAAPTTTGPAAASGESTADTLARLMGGAPPPAVEPAKPKVSGVDVSALVRNLAAPSMVPGATPEQTAALSAVEAELTAQLRGILHHPDFQALEATWRGLDRLVREFGGEENLKLSLLDVSKAELAADLKAQENLALSGLFKSLREKSWALAIGAYTFDASIDDLQTLGRVTRIAELLGAPFVAGASAHFVGCDSVATQPDADQWTRPMPSESRDAWAALRALPEATHLGLTLPRVLMRQPYGKGSDEVEVFAFEELVGEDSHDSYLWGCGAFVCGFLLADAFRAEGWDMTVGGAGELDDLPVYRFSKDGETQIKPCAEVWLSERVGDRISSQGLMALLSIKGRGAVRLVNAQSVAASAQSLALRTS
jgi:predicted component of type VI protein secretion system